MVNDAQGNEQSWLQKNKLNLFFVGITLVYLFFELSFNAWLLNTVGSGGSEQDVSRLEFYGRTLSGIALALVACQLLMHTRLAASGKGIMWVIAIGVSVVLIAYNGLNFFVNKYLIEASTPSERKQYASFVLLQSALVNGTAGLKGLSDNGSLFQTPEGKSFLAIFPYLVSSVDGIEESIFNSKLQIVKNSVADKIGVQNYYNNYKKAMEASIDKWKQYNKAGDFDIDGEIQKQQGIAWNDYLKSLAKKGWTPDTIPPDVDLPSEVANQQNKAWRDYVNDLATHRWTPNTVPWFAKAKVVSKVRHKLAVPKNWNPADQAAFYDAVDQRVRHDYAKKSNGKSYRGSVVAGVRKKVDVPANWNPSDKQTFDNAVAQRVRNEVAKKGGGVVKVNGHVIPPNLSFEGFVLNQTIQGELHTQLQIWPDNVVIKPHYRSEDEFKTQAFDPAVDKISMQKMKEYDSPAETFAPDGTNGDLGLKVARAAIVPPVALFFSLLGATMHSSKLIFLLVGLMGIKVKTPVSERTLDRVKLFLVAIPLFLIVVWFIRWNGVVANGNVTGTGAFCGVMLVALGYQFVKLTIKSFSEVIKAFHMDIKWIALVSIPTLIVTLLLFQQNSITRTELYKTVEQRLLSSKTEEGAIVPVPVKLKALHVISVGQTVVYPICEAFRRTVFVWN